MLTAFGQTNLTPQNIICNVPLSVAVMSGRLELINVLVERGLDCDELNAENLVYRLLSLGSAQVDSVEML